MNRRRAVEARWLGVGTEALPCLGPAPGGEGVASADEVDGGRGESSVVPKGDARGVGGGDGIRREHLEDEGVAFVAELPGVSCRDADGGPPFAARGRVPFEAEAVGSGGEAGGVDGDAAGLGLQGAGPDEVGLAVVMAGLGSAVVEDDVVIDERLGSDRVRGRAGHHEHAEHHRCENGRSPSTGATGHGGHAGGHGQRLSSTRGGMKAGFTGRRGGCGEGGSPAETRRRRAGWFWGRWVGSRRRRQAC